MPAPRRWRQEDWKFRILLSYRENLRQAELQETLSKRIKGKKKLADRPRICRLWTVTVDSAKLDSYKRNRRGSKLYGKTVLTSSKGSSYTKV